MSKKTIVISSVLILLLVLIGGIAYTVFRGSDKGAEQNITVKEASKKVSRSSSKEETIETSTEGSSATADVKSEQEALDTLEKTDQPVSADKTKEIEGQIKSVLESMKGNTTLQPQGNYAITKAHMISNMKMYTSAGYAFVDGSTSAFKSENDGILQFVFNLKNAEGEIISFSGNYIDNTQQVQIVGQKGEVSLAG